MVAWTDALGHASTSPYDEHDRVVSADALSGRPRLTYDDEGRPTSVLRPDVSGPGDATRILRSHETGGTRAGTPRPD
ncbi:hypothetical protein ACIRQY_16350 [Streptomyces sp. NPDC101490]|uniref:hypothetical protein n=1 Tax=Streptomyces sp. NPDC101490 TaxID=3366143 RepID=UPI00380985E4